jgi:hypothetical protein
MKTEVGAFALQPGEGTTYTVGGSPIVYKVRGSETGGRFEITESTLPPRFGDVPPHVHHDTDHAFYVLKGELGVQIVIRSSAAGRAPACFHRVALRTHSAMRGPVHGRYLQIDSGPGRERFCEEIARAFPGDTPIDRKMMGEILARYDTQPASAAGSSRE